MKLTGPMRINASAILFVALLPSLESYAIAQPAVAPTTQQISVSEWGQVSAGVQARLRIPMRIEQNMPVSAEIELKCDRASLPAGVTRFNTAYFPGYLRMILVNPQTAQRFEVVPYDPTLGMPPFDDGSQSISLNGTSIAPQKASFPLLGKPIPPGVYDCVVDYASDRQKNVQADFYKGATAKEPGWWSGRFGTGSASIRIDKETAKTISLAVPTRIRGIRAEGAIGWKFEIRKDDVETVVLPVRNGCFIGWHIHYGDGPSGSTSGLSDPPTPDSLVAELRRNGSSGSTQFNIEVFETTQPPMHLSIPMPGSDGYKTLWKKEFDLSK